MRVIGGMYRGRKLTSQLPSTVRPTSDRVREAVFDILGSLGGVEGLDVVDLFCGSGALGIEALSRGARAVTFVDSDKAALQAVRMNLEPLGPAEGSVHLVRASLPAWLRGATPFDLALCDPPYRFDAWELVLSQLQATTAVLESNDWVVVPPEWTVAKTRRYGGTLVTVARHLRLSRTPGGSS